DVVRVAPDDDVMADAIGTVGAERLAGRADLPRRGGGKRVLDHDVVTDEVVAHRVERHDPELSGDPVDLDVVADVAGTGGSAAVDDHSLWLVALDVVTDGRAAVEQLRAVIHDHVVADGAAEVDRARATRWHDQVVVHR